LTLSVPLKASPLLKYTTSPGLKLEKMELNFWIVFQGVFGFCASVLDRASFPIDEEK
jgi:hypothetical protein